jgi:pSer/pThr/pTyr-binding forkhead associated (FHA) protein
MSGQGEAAVRLVVVKGENTEAVVEGSPEHPITIGKAADNVFVLLDKTVSRRHAVVEVDEAGARVQDLRSLNGVKRNGQRLPPEEWVRLHGGDELELGLTVIRVEVTLPAAAEAAEPTLQETRLITIDDQVELERAEEDANSAGAPQTRPPRSEDVLERFGPYEISRHLAPAGEASVDVAVDSRSDACVALTRVPGARLGFFGRRRFLRACELGRGLEHENVLGVLDCGRDGDVVYATCAHLDGVTVAELLQEGRRTLTVEVAVFVARAVARGLAYLAERCGPRFRAVVTDNRVVVAADGRVALSDVGVPLEPDGGEARRFLAPEEEAGKAGDVRSAVFALGILLYELLARDRVDPDRRMTLTSIDLVRIDVSQDLADLTMRALQVRPEQRFDRPADLEAQLGEVLDAIAPQFGAGDVSRWISEHLPDARRRGA